MPRYEFKCAEHGTTAQIKKTGYGYGASEIPVCNACKQPMRRDYTIGHVVIRTPNPGFSRGPADGLKHPNTNDVYPG